MKGGRLRFDMRAMTGRGRSTAVRRTIIAGSWCVAAAIVVSAQVVWQDVVRNLRHPDPTVRLASVEQLGNANYTAAAEAVAQVIADSNDYVQDAAIEAELAFFLIDRYGGTRIRGLRTSKSRAQEAFEAGPLVRGANPIPPLLVDRLIAAMRDDHERVRFDAVHALGALAEAPLPPAQLTALAAELDHYDPIIRAATCRVLARLRATAAGPAIVATLTDSSPVVRQFAVEALGRVRAEDAVPHLLSLYLRERTEPAAQALLALARIAPASALEHFRKRLADRNAPMRRAAVEGLGRLQDRESLAALQQILKTDRSNAVRLAAHFALQQLGEVHSHSLAGAMALRDLGGDARDYLLEIGRPAIPGVQSALKVATDAQHRADLIQLVGFIGGADDVALVRPFLKDRNERVVRAADNTIVRLTRPKLQ
jgi:HEAT repeat protein